MHLHPRKRNLKTLGGLLVLVVVFLGFVYAYHVLTGIDELNGLIGVCLGLFICAQPAANFLDTIIFERIARHWQSRGRADVLWVAGNLLVLFIGLAVISIGTKLFFRGW